MPLTREEDGTWVLRIEKDEKLEAEKSHPSYWEALPRYLTALDPAFSCARDRSEFEFLLSLFRIRGLQDAGWDPYETTLNAIPALIEVHGGIKNFCAARHLQLWIYGHIVEASEPYELIANLIDVASGGRFLVDRFPPKHCRPLSPGEKVSQIEVAAARAGIPGVVMPLREIWNRDLRNAVFHADYSLHGGEVRTVRPVQRYAHEEIMTIVNRAIAYHHALAHLYRSHLASYQEPKIIDPSPGFARDPDVRAVVVIREGHGAAGLKDAWTAEQVRAGRIPFLVGRFTRDEMELLDADRAAAMLPATPEVNEGGGKTE